MRGKWSKAKTTETHFLTLKVGGNNQINHSMSEKWHL